MAWTDEIAKKLSMEMYFVNNVAGKIGIRGRKHSDGSYEIQDSNIKKLKTACKIVEKDNYFLETLDKLKLAIQIVEKDDNFLKDELERMSEYNLVYSQNLEELKKLADLYYKYQVFLRKQGFGFYKNDKQDKIIKDISRFKMLEFFENKKFATTNVNKKIVLKKFNEIYKNESFIDTETFEILPNYYGQFITILEQVIEEELKEIKNSFNFNSPLQKQECENITNKLQEKYSDFDYLFENLDNEEKDKLEMIKEENQALKSQILELQAKLDLIEQEKKETSEIVLKIKEKYLKFK